jgi:uncharacterized iron-regulated membrane protein
MELTMDSDAGGWLWLVIDVAFVALFAAGLLYGVVMWRNRRRSPAHEQASDAATKELYHRSGCE